ncbi:hypothetical protein GUITHDRAFT_102221 [Guillardia theta CCMP2712]|uniref:Guanylate cyclase domain-containing protein n=1 Tax=Guillardia theta (strain CCMP2712) TaxID=905079 RepID=L1JUU6_GUITC|nr:hypothetical protein GUITHDRAFT_102221 [Guillardia theta CCMP2712]EKX52321.1 hypothetical protein GUITHDRAFT_102221 [Guillardia theta CCMP2712]|eukprot:XP_005839301.1 hypothetical protein GUITHDRAFT_102221 [Guillardia theta CCMP2712]
MAPNLPHPFRLSCPFSCMGNGEGGGQSGQRSCKSMSESPKPARQNLVIGTDETDDAMMDSRLFDKLVLDEVKDLEECKTLLKRTRAVTLMADRMTCAWTEEECYEEVSKLVLGLFGVERCSVALVEDYEHLRVIQMAVTRVDYSKEMSVNIHNTGMLIPLAGSSFGKIAKTLKPLYTPDARESDLIDHKKIASMGLRTIVNAPLLVAGRKFVGALNLGFMEVDCLTTNDQLLIKDIAACLGANLFTRRIKKSQEEDHEVCQNLLHAMIPPKVLMRIEHYWRDRGSQAQPSELSAEETAQDMSDTGSSDQLDDIQQRLEYLRGISSSMEVSVHDNPELSRHLHLMCDSGKPSSARSGGDGGMGAKIGKALYAEEKRNVSIIFSDIVGFSRITDGVPPMKTMNMLHQLFHRFDALCEKHGVFKVETVGDGCVMAAGLLEDNNDNDGGRAAARRALAIAMDMVRETKLVLSPDRGGRREPLTLRVGLHVGDITCGVLGKGMPRFQLFGSTVNLAARMEQTCAADRVHASKKFFELVGGESGSWEGPTLVKVKNMGEVETFTLDPLCKG